jgi:hypothetical protein
MADWRDLLAEQVRGLEAEAGYPDPLLAQKARAMLCVIRGYETRVRHLTLRLDYRLARSLAVARPRRGRVIP